MLQEFLEKKVFAVVGVSSKTEKYGYKVYKHLKGQGKEVYPIHPAMSEIEGDKCYNSLAEVPAKIEVVSVIVPPKATEEVVVQCNDLGIKRVWMQPGAESDKAIKYCEENGIEVVHNACILLGK